VVIISSLHSPGYGRFLVILVICSAAILNHAKHFVHAFLLSVLHSALRKWTLIVHLTENPLTGSAQPGKNPYGPGWRSNWGEEEWKGTRSPCVWSSGSLYCC
jgi:hypothetical protein